MRKSFLKLVALALCLAVALAGQAAHAAGNPRYGAIVIDAKTGAVLFEDNADKQLYPASLTKMMTLYLTFEAIENGRLSLDQHITVSRRAASMSPSKLGLPAGNKIKVRDAILALVTKSANDIAVALAEAVGGSEENFARMMTVRAQNLGMTRTRFTNASGWHSKNQVSTARDMAQLSRALIYHYPQYYKFFSTREFRYGGLVHRNHNHLMSNYKGMDGLKTGYVGASGFNLAASAVRNNRRLIGVVFGGRTTASRNAHMARLLDRSFLEATDLKIASLRTEQLPVPLRKPSDSYKVAAAAPAETMEDFGVELGEGDADPEATRQLAMSLAAMAATNGGQRFIDAMRPAGQQQQQPQQVAAYTPAGKPAPMAAKTPITAPKGNWTIQVGAYKSKQQTTDALNRAVAKLPALLDGAEQQIVPLKTRHGTIYRARLAGLSEQAAHNACAALKDCLRLAPR